MDGPMAAQPPRRLAAGEKLSIKRVIGRGGFACCYEAKWERGAETRRIALKVLLPAHSSPDCLYWTQFLQEAALLRSVQHRTIVTCFDLVELPASQPGLKDTYTGPTLAMLLELVQDGTVSSLIQQQLVSPHSRVYSMAQAFVMAQDIAGAMAHLHCLSPPVLHRDLKLENCLVSRGPSKQLTVKTADYGLHVRLEQARQGHRCCPDALAASTRPSLPSPAEQDAIATSPTSAPAPTTPQRLATSGSLNTALPHATTPKQAPGVVHVRLSPAGALSREHVHARTSDGSSSPLCSLLLPNMTSLSSGSLERSSLPLVLSSAHKDELSGAAAAPNDPMQHTSVSDVCPGESLSPPHRGGLKAALSKQAAAAPVVMLLGPLGQGQGRDSERGGRGAKGQQCLVPADPLEGVKAAGNMAGDCMAAIAAAGKAAGDFPPCKAAMAAVPLARASDDLYCLTGETGSPLYMAPEVFLRKPYNCKADVFSMGVIMYELFSRTLLVFTHLGEGRGRFPTSEAYARAIALNAWRPSKPASIPDDLWRLIQDCWAHDPRHRPSMHQVLDRLLQLQGVLAPCKAQEKALRASATFSAAAFWGSSPGNLQPGNLQTGNFLAGDRNLPAGGSGSSAGLSGVGAGVEMCDRASSGSLRLLKAGSWRDRLSAMFQRTASLVRGKSDSIV